MDSFIFGVKSIHWYWCRRQRPYDNEFHCHAHKGLYALLRASQCWVIFRFHNSGIVSSGCYDICTFGAWQKSANLHSIYPGKIKNDFSERCTGSILPEYIGRLVGLCQSANRCGSQSKHFKWCHFSIDQYKH